MMMPNKAPASNDILKSLPNNLPAPIDDGACDHLTGMKLSPISLLSTSARHIDLSSISGWQVVYIYPMTGKPGVDVPDGWVDIPGAAGCTPQACSYRDNHTAFTSTGVKVFGVSTQTTDEQSEAVNRLKLPYELLSDSELAFSSALQLPLFSADNRQLIKRITLILKDGIIKKCFYPVFPPDKNIDDVIQWLDRNRW